jgi:hypothetical protein
VSLAVVFSLLAATLGVNETVNSSNEATNIPASTITNPAFFMLPLYVPH